MRSGGGSGALEEARIVDKYRLVQIALFLCGAGYLYPYFAILSGLDFFTDKYKALLGASRGIGVDAYFAAAYNLGAMIVYLPVFRLADRFSHKLRMNLGYGAYLVMLIIVPVVNVIHDDVYVSWWLTLLSVFVVGCIDGWLNAAVLSYASFFPGKYMQSVMMGIGAAGLVVPYIRIFTKLTVTSHSSSGVPVSIIVYFVLAGLLVLVSLGAANFMLSLPFAVSHTQRARKGSDAQMYSQVGFDSPATELGDSPSLSEALSPVPIATTAVMQQWRQTFKATWRFALLVFCTFCASLVMFPGVLTGVAHDNEWLSLMLVAVWCTSDFFGRWAVAWHVAFTAKNLWISTTLRNVLLVLAAVLIRFGVVTNIVLMVIVALIGGFSNGYQGTLGVMFGTVAYQDMETASTIMGLSLICGLAVGAFGALALGLF